MTELHSLRLYRRASCGAHCRHRSRDRFPLRCAPNARTCPVDVVSLRLTARRQDYVASTLAACDDDGPCTAIGHGRRLSAAGAALVNGTAAHGEDFDDTFEGGPVHAGAVVVPAVLAACERRHPDGAAALTGIAVGARNPVPARAGDAQARSQARPASTPPP